MAVWLCDDVGPTAVGLGIEGCARICGKSGICIFVYEAAEGGTMHLNRNIQLVPGTYAPDMRVTRLGLNRGLPCRES